MTNVVDRLVRRIPSVTTPYRNDAGEWHSSTQWGFYIGAGRRRLWVPLPFARRDNFPA